MRRHLSIILFIGITAPQIACVSNRSFFQNKILVYNSEESGDFHDSIQNASFIDFYKDSIIVVDYPFRLFEGTTNSLDSNLYPHAAVPMKFSRTKKSIYVNYAIKDKAVHMKYFTLTKSDSVNASWYDVLCLANQTEWNVITRNTCNDTTIDIAGKHVRCWVFKIDYPYYGHPLPEGVEIVYIEKKSLLPVQKITVWRFPDQSDPPIIKTRVTKSRMVEVFKRPWGSANRRWRYAKCYYL